MDLIYSFLDTALPFEWTEFSYMKNAFIAILLITPLFGLVGTMIVNNKMSFFSDALGHSALTGIAVGVLMGIDNYVVSMMGFALLFAICVSSVMDSNISSSDTVIGVFSSTGMALGIVLLSAAGGFAKYTGYLIGDILTVQPNEIKSLFLILIVVVVIWILFFNKLLITSINENLAVSKGIKVKLIKKIFVIVIAVIVTVSIKWVGVLIINSLLVLPAAAARNLAKNTRSYHFISIIISMFSGISGLIISYYTGTAASGTIVIIAAAIFFISYLFNRVHIKN